jgi:hypothetical protein
MSTSKGLIIGAALLALVLIPGNLGLGCGTTPAPPQIPANFVTYTDKSNVFSISYPNDWEIISPNDENTERFITAAIDDLKSGTSSERIAMIFYAGRPTETGHEPSVYVVIEPVTDPPRLFKAVDAELEGIHNVYKDYQEYSRVNTKIGGREATIIDWSGTRAVKGNAHYLEMITVVDKKTTLIVNCSASPEDFAQWQNDFNTIINSFRLNIP